MTFVEHSQLVMRLRTPFDTFQFHARRAFELAPQTTFAFLIATVCLVLAVFALLSPKSTAELSRAQWARTRGSAPPLAAAPITAARPGLASFDAVRFVHVLHDSSGQTGLPIGEMKLSLEDSPTLPYLRYRANLALAAPYADIRRFAALVVAGANSLSLDTVVCTREVGATAVKCDLSFSQVYLRSDRG